MTHTSRLRFEFPTDAPPMDNHLSRQLIPLDALLGALLDLHAADATVHCADCHQPWPCTTRQLITETLEKLR